MGTVPCDGPDCFWCNLIAPFKCPHLLKAMRAYYKYTTNTVGDTYLPELVANAYHYQIK